MSCTQTKKRVLFVCHQNQVRSRTAEEVYRGRSDLEVRSAGIAEYAAVPLTGELLDWADWVFVFSKRQQRIVEARYGDRSDRKKLVCLGLPDRFEYKSPELVSRLTGKLGRYLGVPGHNERGPAAKSPAPRIAEKRASASNPDNASLLRIVFRLFNGVPLGTKALSEETRSP
jgi:predicted protein tyrosine phosphatase